MTETPPREVVPEPQSLADAVAQLRRPFTPAAVKWKIQTNPKDASKSALCVGYIDARLVSERLNAVLPGRWSKAYHAAPALGPKQAGVLCRIRVKVGDDEVVVEDVGTANTLDTEMGLKGLYSDALKRAAVGLGIGVSIYAVPQQYLKASELRSYQGGGGTKYALSDANLRTLSGRYAKWLRDGGEELFGKPLDHGDAEDAQGDAEVDAPEHDHDGPALPAWAAPASDEQVAQAARAAAYLLADDADAVSALFGKLGEKLGGVPAGAALIVGLTAAAVKAKNEAADVQAEGSA
jgi:hypothetical protein